MTEDIVSTEEYLGEPSDHPGGRYTEPAAAATRLTKVKSDRNPTVSSRTGSGSDRV